MTLRRCALWLAAFLLLAACASFVTLDAPYHSDTASYMKTVRAAIETGTLAAGYTTRPVAGLLLLPLAPLLGEGTLHATMVLAWAGAVILLCRFFAGSAATREPRHLLLAAAAALAWALSPAAFISASHLKEDSLALGLVLVAALAVGAPRWTLLGGIAFGLGVMTKETALLCTPLILGLAALGAVTAGNTGSEHRRRPVLAGAGMRILAVLGGAIAAVLVVAPSHFAAIANLTKHASTGQFLGPFAELPGRGLEAWHKALGPVLFWVQLGALAWPFTERTVSRRLLAGLVVFQAVVLVLFLGNTTVIHYRHFLWVSALTLPAAALGIGELAARVTVARPRAARWAQFGIASTLLAAAWVLVPELVTVARLRVRYNPVAEFYLRLGASLPPDAVLLGMDYCEQAEYFTRRRCLAHAGNPSPAEASEYADALGQELAAGHSVYALPDVFTYDSQQTVRRALLQRFDALPAFRAWFENYHAMDFGLTLPETRAVIGSSARGCSVTERRTAPESPPPNLEFSMLAFDLQCPEQAPRTTRSFVELPGGLVLPTLQLTTVYQFRPNPAG